MRSSGDVWVNEGRDLRKRTENENENEFVTDRGALVPAGVIVVVYSDCERGAESGNRNGAWDDGVVGD